MTKQDSTPTATPSAIARLRTWWASDRGGVLETVIIVPIVFLIFFGGIQGALYYHARNVALKAGEEGLRQTRSQFGNPALGTAAAYAFIAQTGPTTLRAPVVVMNRTPREATVQIVGQPIQLIPFMNLTVTLNQTAPLERITNPGELW